MHLSVLFIFLYLDVYYMCGESNILCHSVSLSAKVTQLKMHIFFQVSQIMSHTNNSNKLDLLLKNTYHIIFSIFTFNLGLYQKDKVGNLLF